MRKNYKFKKKFLQEILSVMEKYGYDLDIPVEDLGLHTGIVYDGPKGGYDVMNFGELIADLVKFRLEPKPIPVEDVFTHPYLSKLGKSIIVAKEIFEATLKESHEESGQTLRSHIEELLQPFKEVAQLEWAVDEIMSVCDSELEPYRGLE